MRLIKAFLRDRALHKAVSWRILGSLDTTMLTWIFSGSFKIATFVGSAEVVTKIFLYWIHEKIWERIKRNAVSVDQESRPED